MSTDKRAEFLNRQGKDLLKNFSLQAEGLWQIYGEDPNPDLSGPHIEPNLGVVEGRLDEVIDHAVNLKNFWAWGGGGRIVKVVPQKPVPPVKIPKKARTAEGLEWHRAPAKVKENQCILIKIDTENPTMRYHVAGYYAGKWEGLPRFVTLDKIKEWAYLE